MNDFEMKPPSGGLGDVERRAGVIARARRIAWTVRTAIAVVVASFVLSLAGGQGQLASDRLENVGASLEADTEMTTGRPSESSSLGGETRSSNPPSTEYAFFGLGGLLVLGGVRLAGRSGRGLSRRPSVPALLLAATGAVAAAIGLVRILS